MLSHILVQYQCLYFFFCSSIQFTEPLKTSLFLQFSLAFHCLCLPFLYKFIICFQLCWVFVAVLSCSKQVLSSRSAWTSHCSGFPCCGARTAGHVGLSSRSTGAQQLWLWNSRAQASRCGSWAWLLCGMWDPSDQG